MGSGTVCGFGHLLGSWDASPVDKGGTTVLLGFFFFLNSLYALHGAQTHNSLDQESCAVLTRPPYCTIIVPIVKVENGSPEKSGLVRVHKAGIQPGRPAPEPLPLR